MKTASPPNSPRTKLPQRHTPADRNIALGVPQGCKRVAKVATVLKKGPPRRWKTKKRARKKPKLRGKRCHWLTPLGTWKWMCRIRNVVSRTKLFRPFALLNVLGKTRGMPLTLAKNSLYDLGDPSGILGSVALPSLGGDRACSRCGWALDFV